MANETCRRHEAHRRPACPGGPQPYKTHSFVPPVRNTPSPSSALASVKSIVGLYVHIRKIKSPIKQVLGLRGSQAVLSWPARLTQVSPSPGPVISGSNTSGSSTHHALTALWLRIEHSSTRGLLARIPRRECVFPLYIQIFLQGEFWITRGSRVLTCHVVLMTRSPSAWSDILHQRRRRGARSWQRGSWH